MLLLYFYLIFTQSIFSAENTISSAHSLQNICFRAAAEEVLTSPKASPTHWLKYFAEDHKYSRNTDHRDGLVFQRELKNKIGWTNISINMIEDMVGCNFEEKYFKQEKIKIKKTLNRFTGFNIIMGGVVGACIAAGCTMLIPAHNGEGILHILLAFHLWNSIYFKKIAKTRHEISVEKIRNNNRNDGQYIIGWSVNCSYQNSEVLLSKNYLQDNCYCVMTPQHIHYNYDGKRGYEFNNFNYADPIQLAFTKSMPNTTFTSIPTQLRNKYSFLLMRLNNQELSMMVYNYWNDRYSNTQTHKEENIDNYCTTLGRFCALQKNKTIRIARLQTPSNPLFNYLPGCIENAQLFHLDEETLSILYSKDNRLYLQNFDAEGGILDENSTMTNENLENKVLSPQPLLALDNELPFSYSTFELIPTNNYAQFLFFKIINDTLPQQHCVIWINPAKKTWAYLAPSEIKLLDNPLYEIKNMRKLMQEKSNDFDTQFNLYKNEDRNLILKKAKTISFKPTYITTDSIFAFA